LTLDYLEALEYANIQRLLYIKPETGKSYFKLVGKPNLALNAHVYAWLRDEGYIEVPKHPEGAELKLPAAVMVAITDKGLEALSD
jgi:hypothetical protein